MVLICRVKAIQIENTKEKEEKNIVDGVWKKKYHNEKERNMYLQDKLCKCEEELLKWRRGRQFIILIKMYLIIAVMHTTYPVVKLKPEKINQSYLYIFISISAVKYMKFRIFTSVLQLRREYYELTKWAALRWLLCSVGRALHQYRKGYGLDSHSGLKFFQALFSKLLKLCA